MNAVRSSTGILFSSWESICLLRSVLLSYSILPWILLAPHNEPTESCFSRWIVDSYSSESEDRSLDGRKLFYSCF